MKDKMQHSHSRGYLYGHCTATDRDQNSN